MKDLQGGQQQHHKWRGLGYQRYEDWGGGEKKTEKSEKEEWGLFALETILSTNEELKGSGKSREQMWFVDIWHRNVLSLGDGLACCFKSSCHFRIPNLIRAPRGYSLSDCRYEAPLYASGRNAERRRCRHRQNLKRRGVRESTAR